MADAVVTVTLPSGTRVTCSEEVAAALGIQPEPKPATRRTAAKK